jgi:ATP-binding cassette subfamily B protein
MLRRLQRLSFTYHDTVGTSDSTYRVQYDAPAIANVFVSGLSPIVTSIVTLVAMIWVMVSIDPELALVALVVAPLLFFQVRYTKHRSRNRWRQVKGLESSSMSVIQEVLGNLRVVKSFGQEEREQQRFMDVSSMGLRARIKVYAFELGAGSVMTLTLDGGTALVLYLGAVHVQQGAITAGELTLVMGYMSQIYSPLKTISSSITGLQKSLASAERAYSVLDQAADVDVRPGARRLGRARGAVRMETVAFAYPGGKPVLTDVSLDVPAGATVGIQGRTGSGKTTLASLLMRFYDPQTGRILLDGVDLRDYRLEDLRSQYAVVLQDPVLFSRSIAENIAYAQPDATFEQIAHAASLANAHEFISTLPDGYDTLVGERGMKLSGGERQRISLARAFLKDAPILILDEPTSAVDVGTESLIVDAMTRLMRGRTTFMIAHRLSTLDSCDMRVEVVDGRVSVLAPTVPVPVDGESPVPARVAVWAGS